MEMKFTITLVLICALSTAYGGEDTKSDIKKRFDGIAEVLCNDKQQISDDQLAQLETKCGSNNTTTRDELLKQCLNVKELTDRQKVLSLCGTQKACIVDNWVKKFDSVKSEECKKFCNMGDKYIKKTHIYLNEYRSVFGCFLGKIMANNIRTLRAKRAIRVSRLGTSGGSSAGGLTVAVDSSRNVLSIT
ncbi:unnamed protein product [Medioppia subpectinata]|uniref:Uncharacterized protein n=1 Tax=Medioppia subpectinata TaxID=1979941 RepID=A0A7R9PUJ0_9ACAR|nr:unnamed protein product [Medioppia subpectinata]CAG2100828.1 unnamed protein product [Medioppia subpectinata]